MRHERYCWLLLLGGCESAAGDQACPNADPADLPSIPLVAQTPHLQIYSSEPICAGTPLELEKQVMFAADYVGADLRSGIPVLLWPGAPEACGNGWSGCWTGGAVFSLPDTAFHELAHAALCEIHPYDGINSTFSEGIAVMLDPGVMAEFWSPTSIEDLLASSKSARHHEKAHFSRWLVETRGLDAYVELYREPGGVDPPLAALSIEAVYGESLAQLNTEWLTTVGTETTPLRDLCEGLPSLEAVDGTFEFAASVTCDDPRTVGPVLRSRYQLSPGTDPWSLMSQAVFVIDIEEHWRYDYYLSGASLFVEACRSNSGLVEPEGGTRFLLGEKLGDAGAHPDFRAGRYRVVVDVPFGDSREYEWRMWPIGPPIGQ